MEIKLIDFVKNECIKNIEYSYGGISGFAETIGYNIIIFRAENENEISSIVFEDIGKNEKFASICNEIFKSLNIEAKIFDSFEKIKSLYGEIDFSDNVYENILRVYYLTKEHNLFCFGFEDSVGLTYFEMIKNQIIILNRINFLDNHKY